FRNPPGRLAEHDDVADILGRQQRAHRTAHHRLAADRDQCLQISPVRFSESIAPGPRTGEHDRGVFHVSSQLTTGCPRAARSLACASRTAWKIRLTIVHHATNTRPVSGLKNGSEPARMTMFGLRRAVTSRNLLSSGRQTWISMPWNRLIQMPSMARWAT